MSVLVAIETLLLALGSVLLVGVLRSHAEILRRLGEEDPQSSAVVDGRLPLHRVGGELSDAIPSPPDRPAPRAVSIAGSDLAGGAMQFSLRKGSPNTLLAFLGSGCLTCGEFFKAFQAEARPPIPGNARLIIVSKDSHMESPTKLRALAPEDIPLVMSSRAWEQYRIPGAPYFVYIDGASGSVHGEGAAMSWEQVQSLLTDALADAELAAQQAQPRARRRRGGGARSSGESAHERGKRADAALQAAGIPADHPSLWGGPVEDPQT